MDFVTEAEDKHIYPVPRIRSRTGMVASDGRIDEGQWEISVPAPDRTRVLILAECPSPGLLPVFMAGRSFDEESTRRMVFAAAEPGRLLARIDHFLMEMGDARRMEKVGHLVKLFHHGHLIYLCKEPTADRVPTGRFTSPSVRDEVDSLLRSGVGNVVALGEATQRWFRSNYPMEGLTLISLPTPSNHISDWFPSFLERMNRERGADTLMVREAMAAQIDVLVAACSRL